MAGGKASPRQKMINMMYLVLTALLALQISAEILHSFQVIAESLAGSASKISTKNDKHGADLKEYITVKEKGNAKIQKYAAEIETIQKKTQEQYSYLEALVDSMNSIGDYDKTTGEYAKSSETEANYRFWMMSKGKETDNGGRGAGAAFELRNKLNGFVGWANEWLKANNYKGDPLKEICTENKEAKGEIAKKTWEYGIFHGSPVVANVAIVQKLKSDVLNVQSELLAHVEGLVGQVPYKIDSLILISVPSAYSAPAGTKISVKLLVGATSKQAKPKYSSNAGALKMNPDGSTATVDMTLPMNFPAGAQSFDFPFSFSAQIPKTDGTMTNLKSEAKIKVTKPSGYWVSDVALALYTGCGNELRAVTPSLGDEYPINATATGCNVSPKAGAGRGAFVFVPQGKETNITLSTTVSGQNIVLNTQKYTCKNPPQPDVVIGKGTAKWDGISPINKGETIWVGTDPDKEFAKLLPKDCRYKMTTITIRREVGLGPLETLETIPVSNLDAYAKANINLGNYRLKAQTRIYVEVDKVTRVNYLNASIDEAMARQVRIKSFTVK